MILRIGFTWEVLRLSKEQRVGFAGKYLGWPKNNEWVLLEDPDLQERATYLVFMPLYYLSQQTGPGESGKP